MSYLKLCDKCSGKNFSTAWRYQTVSYGTPIGGIGNNREVVLGEHMLYTCETCGWRVAERPDIPMDTMSIQEEIDSEKES